MVEVENTSKHICRHPIFYNNNNTRFITQFCSGYTIFLYSVACTEFQRHEYSEQRAFRVGPNISAFLFDKQNKWNVKLTKVPSNLRELHVHVLLNSE